MGAWIEIERRGGGTQCLTVAPVWGRGLKLYGECSTLWGMGRPRMGAWIEIRASGCWATYFCVAPVWGRGLKSIHHDGTAVIVVSPPYGGVD